MKLKIRVLDQDDVNVEVPDNASIDTLSKTIAEKSNMPTNQQRLIFRGQLMQPGSLLSDYGISDGCDTNHNSSRDSSSSTNTNENTNQTGQSGRTSDSANHPVSSSSISISMVLEEPSGSGGSSPNPATGFNDMLTSFLHSIANPSRFQQQQQQQQQSSSSSSTANNNNTSTASSSSNGSGSGSNSSGGFRRRVSPLGPLVHSGDRRRRRTNSNQTIHIVQSTNSNNSNNNQQQQQQPPPPSQQQQRQSNPISHPNSTITNNYNYIFEILSNTERRMSSLNNSLRQSPMSIGNNNRTVNEMIGELLQKLMLILSESISPLLQLSELLLTNSVIDRNLINLVSSSLNEISMSSNCCSNLLLEYCRMNNGNDAEIQTDTTTATTTTTTTTTASATATNQISQLCENVTNSIHEIVEHKNDISGTLNSEEKTDDTKMEETD